MARYAGVTQWRVWQVWQVWQAADLKPQRLQTFKPSQDAVRREGDPRPRPLVEPGSASWSGAPCEAFFTSVTELREAIRRFIETRNTHAAKRWSCAWVVMPKRSIA